MATLTAVSPERAANELEAVAAAAGGDEFANTGGGRRLLVIENGSGSPMTLTVTTQATVDGEAADDKTIAVPAGERHLIGPFPASIYNDGDGNVQLAYSDETSVTVAVITVP